MNKPKLAVLVASYGAAAFVGYEASRKLSKIGTPPISVSHYRAMGDVVNAEGSWKRVGGHDMTTPEPNTVRIRCDTHEGQCTMDEAQVEDWSGFRYLRLVDTVEYRIISWEAGILVAQAVDSSGAAFKSHDITLRISVDDKSVTRTWHGKRMAKFLGEKDVDLSSEWLEETLR